jgi:Tol biopolymer transport system component
MFSGSRRAVAGATLVCALLVGREGPVSVRAQAPSTPATASGALQRGLTLMETRGDCAAALPHFDSASRSTEPSTAARALLLRGQCEERLGRPTDARATYQRLLRSYPLDPSATSARARLARLRAPAAALATSPVLRQLQVAQPTSWGSVSGDGRFFAYHDDGGLPWRQDLTTGRTTQLTVSANDADGIRAGHLQLSPDGRQLAFAWATDDGRDELRVMTAPNGTPWTLRAADNVQIVRPVAWSANARAVLVVTTDERFHIGLELIDVATKAISRLAELGVVEPFGVTMTGDARWVAFDHASNPGPRDIKLLDVRTKQVRTLLGQASNDTLPVFLNGGRSLLFASDRLGPLSLWRLPLANGEAVEEPVVVRRDVGRIWPLGMSPSGTFVYAVQNGLVDVHVARLGEDGRLEQQPAPVTATFAGSNISPQWSRDGRSLAYVSQRGAMTIGPGARALVVRDHATGAERFLYPDLTFFIQPRWSPDGTRIIVKGRSAESNKWGLHIVDARSGAVASALTAETVDSESEIGSIQWVPGREAILVGRHGKGIIEFDLKTGIEQVIVPVAAGVNITAGNGCSYGPDGRTLAWSVREGRGPKSQHILRVRDADGTIRELLRAMSPEWLMMHDWAPDGRALFIVRQFPMRPGGGPERSELWRVPLDGTAPLYTGLSVPTLRGVSVHPDGRTIAYTAGLPTWEVWAMEGIR